MEQGDKQQSHSEAPSLDEKETLALKAVRMVQNQIIGTDKFDSTSAQKLGGLLIAYDTQQATMRLEIDKTEGNYQDEYEKRQLDDLQKEVDVFLPAVSAAEKGDYSLVKQRLTVVIDHIRNRFIKHIYGKDSKESQPALFLGMQLAIMLPLIPDKGEPFQSPPPAWEDQSIISAPDPGDYIDL